MDSKNYQKEKEDCHLPNIIRGKTSSYTKDKIYFNMEKDTYNYQFKSPIYNNNIYNNIFSIKEIDNKIFNKKNNNFRYNFHKSKDNKNNYGIISQKVFNSFEYKSKRKHRLNSRIPNIRENLINQRYKIQSESNNRNNIIIDGRIFGSNSQEKGDIILYNNEKKFYLNSKRMIEELIKERNKIKQLNKNTDEIGTKEKDIKKEMEELLKIKNEYEILTMKNKELEKEIEEIKLKYQSQEKVNNEELMAIYKKPTLIGLNNAHNIFNSALQCLSQTSELTSYFLNNKNIEEIINDNNTSKDKNDKKLSPSYLKLIQNLWNINGAEAYSSDEFLDIIKSMNPLFEIENENKLKEFIIFIIEQLHRELKKSKINNNNSEINETPNQYDRNNIFNYCYNKLKEESSIISDLFFGLKETSNECLNCRNNYNSNGLLNNSICYNYEMFDCLIFPLEEIKNIKDNYMRNNNNQINNNYITLNDCFSYNQRLEYYIGDNKNYCNACKQLSECCYNNKIFFSPKILILIMKRDQENEYNLNFEETLDITDFVYSKDVPILKYALYGVISDNRKEIIPHFVSSCKSPIDNKWYRYDDIEVTSITNVEKDVIQYGNPYILFYKKS